MVTKQRQASYDSFRILDVQSWLPTFGLWCGPGWSAGERNSQLTEEELRARPVFFYPDGRASQVDQICKEHDLDYFRARGARNEARLIAEADFNLSRKLLRLNFLTLPRVEATYATFMVFTFQQKMMMINLPKIGVDLLKRRIDRLTSQIAKKITGINGLVYSDAFGNTMTGSAFMATVEGLAYVLRGVTYTRAGDGTSYFNHYRDAYQNLYSGYSPEYPATTSAYVKVWVDGTVSLVDGSRQMQLANPSNGGAAKPRPGDSVTPIPGSGQDVGQPRFFWNGLYMFDGRKWSYQGPNDFEAWVCVADECAAVPRTRP